ncbi:MAG: hypothetical protein FJ151_03645 [Euryarchaeota archaeon]|nr:hypothetical protein [Euryarchaeota archaeon]
MRIKKAWIVAKKDLSEFKTNKYIIFSLILMPLIMAMVMPVVYLVPMTMFSAPPAKEPLDLELNTTLIVVGGNLTNATVHDLRFVGTNLTDVIATGCIFERCNLTSSLIRDSFLVEGFVNASLVVHSNLENTTRIGTVLNDCVILWETSELEVVLKLFIDSLLIFFILIPAIIPTIIASYSFVGEKVNKSLEPLLATPTTDLELLVGKSLSIFLPTMAVTWLSLIPFVALVDLIAEPYLGFFPLPNAVWVIGVFVLAPLFCLLSISANVLVSSRVNDVRASQQIGSLIVLPLIVFLIVTIAGVFTLDVAFMLLFCLLIAGVDAAVVYLSLKVFQREEILVRWK